MAVRVSGTCRGWELSVAEERHAYDGMRRAPSRGLKPKATVWAWRCPGCFERPVAQVLPGWSRTALASAGTPVVSCHSRPRSGSRAPGIDGPRCPRLLGKECTGAWSRPVDPGQMRLPIGKLSVNQSATSDRSPAGPGRLVLRRPGRLGVLCRMRPGHDTFPDESQAHSK